MDELKVLWTTTAVRQRNLIFEYWNARNKNNRYSRKLNSMINERIDLLRTFPEIGTEIYFKKTRATSLGNYNILYKLDSPKLIISAIWDNRQDPDKIYSILKDLKSQMPH